MSTASSQSGQVAARYAGALLDMAEQGKALDAVEKDLRDLQAMLGESADLQRLVENPLLTRSQQSKALLTLADKAGFQQLTRNFLGVVIENNRLAAITGIIRAFQTEMRSRRGEVAAKVQTAYALTPEQTDTLQKELSAAMGSLVTLDVEVDKDLLGGMIVTVGSRMIDNSVKRKLERLRRAMNSNEQQQKEVG